MDRLDGLWKHGAGLMGMVADGDDEVKGGVDDGLDQLGVVRLSPVAFGLQQCLSVGIDLAAGFDA